MLVAFAASSALKNNNTAVFVGKIADYLAGLRFLEHEKRRANYVDPDKLKGFNDEDWIRKWTAEAEDGRIVMQDAMDERAKFVPGSLDSKYAAIEKYLI